MVRIYKIVCLVIMALSSAGWLNEVSAFEGFLLFGAQGGKITVLLDSTGTVAHSWDHSQLPDDGNGYSCYISNGGNLLRSAIAPPNITVSGNAAPRQGVLTEVDRDGNSVWTYTLANIDRMMHHDFKELPNGNLLCVAFETVDSGTAIKKGIDKSLFKGGMMMGARAMESEMIFELDKSSNQIVWEWHILDHVVPKEQASSHPELFSGGLGPFFGGQWVHLNGIDFNPEKNLIVFSSRVMSEIFVLDRSTTIQEAAGHTGGVHGKGGDILYRWGRASNYGMTSQVTITTLHCPTWITKGYPGEGDIMFFHNNAKMENYQFTSLGNSQVIQVKPPMDENGKFLSTSGSAFGLQPGSTLPQTA